MAWPIIPYLIGAGTTAVAQRGRSMALAAAIVSGLSYMYKTKLGLFISMAMIWLGINWATIKLVIQPAVALLLGFAEAPGGGGEFATVAWGWLGVMQFDRALTMVVSAVVTKHATMQGRLFLFKRGVGAPAGP